MKRKTTEDDIKYLLAHRNRILDKLPKVYRKGEDRKLDTYMKAIEDLTREIERLKFENDE